MSTDTAIAAVTLAIRQELQTAINRTPDLEAEVISESPDKLSGGRDATVNVYLYQGQINPFLRNDDLEPEVIRNPKRGKPAIVRRWTTPLMLHYLISFYGDERMLIPQRLMALSVAALHRNPIITPKTLAAVAAAQFPEAPPLDTDDLEPVSIRMQTMSLDEVHRIWSAMRAPYALSTLYEVRTAIVESEPERSRADLVEEVDIDVENKRKPPDVPITGTPQDR